MIFIFLNISEKLFGAHEIQRFNRDADETIAWINEKDALISSDDCGKDLASVQVKKILKVRNFQCWSGSEFISIILGFHYDV